MSKRFIFASCAIVMSFPVVLILLVIYNSVAPSYMTNKTHGNLSSEEIFDLWVDTSEESRYLLLPLMLGEKQWDRSSPYQVYKPNGTVFESIGRSEVNQYLGKPYYTSEEFCSWEIGYINNTPGPVRRFLEGIVWPSPYPFDKLEVSFSGQHGSASVLNIEIRK
ncbi:MAG: hypothetical protein AAGH99_09060 [Planctomycetota bacterium]